MAKTVEEISRDTGFSVTTVRFVINGQADKYRISAKTRQLIEDHIAVHGYRLNHAARSLKLNKSETLGFVVPDLSNTFFARVMAELETLCRDHNFLLLTVSSHEDPDQENKAVANLLARGVDGLAIASCQGESLLPLTKNNKYIPVVMFDRDYRVPNVPVIISDNYQSAMNMSERMLAISEGAVYFLAGQTEIPSIQERIRGFLAACQRANIHPDHALVRRDGEDCVNAGRRMMRTLFEDLEAPPRAFICSSLLVLEGALLMIKERQGSIDNDILIGTFDDHTMLDLMSNRVLSIRQDEATLAKRIFEQLVERGVDKERPSSHIVPSTLICRNL